MRLALTFGMGAKQIGALGFVGLLVGCGDPGSRGVATFGPGAVPSDSEGDEPEPEPTPDDEGDDDDDDDATTSGGDGLPDPDDSADSSGVEVPIECNYPSTTFGGPMQQLDIMGDPDSSFRLTYSVLGLPDPELITSATLRFVAYDADHPGQEGLIYVNGSTGYDIPADEANENSESVAEVDVTASVQAGANTIEFGPGPLERSFFHIGDVELDIVATVDECEELDDTGATGMGVQQEIHYSDAEYTQRNNWVWRCQQGFDYAYTAANTKHVSTDCEGKYAPDGSAHGTATFHFQDVVEDDYLVEIHAYHTWNRNPNGALILVDGVSGLVNQRTSMEGESYFETAEWGIAHLEGDVDIVLDSSQGGYASDAVSWIRITPVQ